MAVKVGSFAKKADGTGTQAITGVGFKPRVILLWTSGATADSSWAASYRLSFGMAARNASDTITQGASSIASQDGQDTSNVSQRTALKALTIVTWGESIDSECDLQSFDSDGFTLNWTTNSGTGYLIHYMTLSGSDFIDAKIVEWDRPATATAKVVTGVGFQPDFVSHLTAQAGALPTVLASGMLGLGMMTASTQLCAGWQTTDNLATSRAGRAQDETTTIIVPVNGDTAGIDVSAAYTSLDADGFTVTYDDVAPGTAGKNLSLCLKGGSYAIGYFLLPGSTGDQAIEVGFAPEGMFFWANNTAGMTILRTTNLAATLGASDGTNHGCVLVQGHGGQAITNDDNYSDSGAAVVMGNNNTATITEEAIATLDANGFTLNWSVAANSLILLYFAFRGGPAEEDVKNKIINC